jgi:hypothetical protein
MPGPTDTLGPDKSTHGPGMRRTDTLPKPYYVCAVGILGGTMTHVSNN